MDIGSLPTSVKVIKMLAELERRMDEHNVGTTQWNVIQP